MTPTCSTLDHSPAAGAACPCHLHPSHPSLTQSLDELDFQRSIHGAAASGDLARIQKLLTSHNGAGHLIHTRDASGLLPIHYAARNAHAHVIPLLADPWTLEQPAQSGSQLTALHRAVLARSAPTVKALLDACGRGKDDARQRWLVSQVLDADGRSVLALAHQVCHGNGESDREIVALLSKWAE